MFRKRLTRTYINDLMVIVETENKTKKQHEQTQHNTHGAASKSDCY